MNLPHSSGFFFTGVTCSAVSVPHQYVLLSSYGCHSPWAPWNVAGCIMSLFCEGQSWANWFQHPILFLGDLLITLHPAGFRASSLAWLAVLMPCMQQLRYLSLRLVSLVARKNSLTKAGWLVHACIGVWFQWDIYRIS